MKGRIGEVGFHVTSWHARIHTYNHVRAGAYVVTLACMPCTDMAKRGIKAYKKADKIMTNKQKEQLANVT